MQLNMRDWRLPVLVGLGFLFARLAGGQLPYYVFYLSTLLFALAYFWTRFALARTEGLIQIEKDSVEVGQSLGVRVRIDNDTFLPLPWAEIDDKTPQHLVETDMPQQATSVPLLGSRVITFRLTARRRGHYAVGPIQITLGDAFGLFKGTREFRSKNQITVYPRVHRIDRMPVPLSQPFGPVRTREKAFEDPSNQAEIRPYRPGDNPRHIHWKTSARLGEMMMREFEVNATTPIYLFPDLCAESHLGTSIGAAYSTEETVVELAASLAALGLRRKMDVGMVAHAQDRFSVSPGRGQRTFHEIMEVLARVEATGLATPRSMLESETAHLPGRSTVVVITPMLTPQLCDILIRLRANHQVMLVLLRKETFVAANDPTGQADATAEMQATSLASLLILKKIAVYLVSATDDLRRLADLKLTGSIEGVRARSHGARA